jgi:hypothetical protein
VVKSTIGKIKQQSVVGKNGKIEIQAPDLPGINTKMPAHVGFTVLDELEGWAEDCVDGSNKLILTGHRGCGKSTLLAEFSRRLAGRYFTVFFSISDLIEMSDVNHVNILFAIAVQMMEEAEARNVKIKRSIKREFYRWFGKYTRTETSTLEAELEAGYEIGGGFNILPSIIKIDASILAQ